jgi:hypothetical protein
MMFGGTSAVTVGVANADGDAPVDPVQNRRRWYAIIGTTISIVGFSAGLTMLNYGMRSVEKTAGGFCASGGPYQIANQCTSGETRQVFIGVIVMLVFGGFFAGLTGWADGPVLTPSGLMWAALFGSLGYEFLRSGASGNLIAGILFILMAAGGLWPALTSGLGWIKRGGNPEPEPLAFDGKQIVHAAVPAPVTNAQPSTPMPEQSPLVPKRLIIPPKEI